MATVPPSTLQLSNPPFSSSSHKPHAPPHPPRLSSFTTRATPDDSDTTTNSSDPDDFDSRLSQIRIRYRSGTGKKAEVRKSKKSKKPSSAGIYLPPVPLKEATSGGLKVDFGFSPYSERVNGRIAILGLSALILVELATGKSVIQYHSPAIVFLQVYFVAAVSAVYVKYEKEKVSVWPQTPPPPQSEDPSVQLYAIAALYWEAGIVLVHPYSVLGGSQGLMKGIARGLADRGFTAVTFDMRGVGRSTGRPSLTGSSEVRDVLSVCKWVSLNLSSNRILLIGSSAGAPIAGSAVDQLEEVVGYVSLGYPFGLTASILFGRHHKAILQSPKPKLFVMGTRDGFTSVKQLENKLKSAAGRVETHLLEGVGHFQMEGPAYDTQMVDLIIGFIRSLQIQPAETGSLKSTS